jgi:hypothetical protein
MQLNEHISINMGKKLHKRTERIYHNNRGKKKVKVIPTIHAEVVSVLSRPRLVVPSFACEAIAGETTGREDVSPAPLSSTSLSVPFSASEANTEAAASIVHVRKIKFELMTTRKKDTGEVLRLVQKKILTSVKILQY